jgi:hypothetical protein
MPRILLTITALLAALVVVAGCGSDSSSSSGATSLVPAGSLIYGEANLHPDEEQQAAINSLIEKFPGEGSAGERIRGLLEKAFSESDLGLSYSKDIEPWLGDQAGFFLSSFASGADMTGAAVIATDDEDKANDAIDKAKGGKDASYKGHDYRTFSDDTAAGVVDGWVVVGNESGFKAAVDTAEGGNALEDDDAYTKALDGAAQERLGFVYFNTPGFAKQLQGSGAPVGPFADLFKDPVLATVNATEKGVRLESTLPKSLSSAIPILGQGGKLAADLPADSWLALSVPDLGETISGVLNAFASTTGGRDALEQQLEAATGLDLDKDVLSWMGDASLFVRGTSLPTLNGALVVETSDEAASKRVIDTIAGLVRKSADGGEHVGPFNLSGGGEGYTLRTPALPQPIHLFQREGKVVLAYGDAAAQDALHPAGRLGDTMEYKDAQEALGGDYDLAFYLGFPSVVSLVDSIAGDDEGWLKVKPYLEPLGALVAGAKKDGDQLRSAVGITVK